MKEFGFSDEIISVYNLAISQFGNNDKVFLIDIGNKYENDKRTDDLCVRIHSEGVNANVSENALFQFIDYLNYGAQHDRKVLPVNSQRIRKFDTIQPGISIGYSGSGTLGLICYDKLNAFRPCLLTAAHVIQGPIGATVTQPGRGLDRGHPVYHAIANILRFDPNGDTAIALLNGRRGTPELHQFETSNIINSIRKVRIGDVLTKSGRTTGLTNALVDGIGVFFQKTNYSRKAINGFRLVPLDSQNREITEISDNGDSGATWFDASTNEGIGLLFAGEKSTNKDNLEFSFAQHLTDVFNNLQISITKNI